MAASDSAASRASQPTKTQPPQGNFFTPGAILACIFILWLMPVIVWSYLRHSVQPLLNFLAHGSFDRTLPQIATHLITKGKAKIARYHHKAASMEAQWNPDPPTPEQRRLWREVMLEITFFLIVLGRLDFEIGSPLSQYRRTYQVNKLVLTRDALEEVVIDFTKVHTRIEAELFRMAKFNRMDPVHVCGLPRPWAPCARMVEEAKESGKKYM